jgi:hypothetical protein
MKYVKQKKLQKIITTDMKTHSINIYVRPDGQGIKLKIITFVLQSYTHTGSANQAKRKIHKLFKVLRNCFKQTKYITLQP